MFRVIAYRHAMNLPLHLHNAIGMLVQLMPVDGLLIILMDSTYTDCVFERHVDDIRLMCFIWTPREHRLWFQIIKSLYKINQLPYIYARKTRKVVIV